MRMRLAGHVPRTRDLRNSYYTSIMVGKSEGNRQLQRPKRRWKDNIRTDLREIRSEVVDWIHLAQDRDRWRVLLNTVIKLRVP